MADYRGFEQNYPTLNKFVGAAREAAAMIPGAGYLTPQDQGYQDARTRFQQQDPSAAMAGKLVGLGVDAAGAIGAGGAALGALGRSAAAAARVPAMEQWGAAQEAMQAAGSQGPIAGNAVRAGLDAARQGVMDARSAYVNAPNFIAPTPSAVATGVRQAAGAMGRAPTLSAAIGGLGIGGGAAMLPNRGPTFNQQQQALGEQAGALDKQLWAARPNDTPDEHLRRARLINFMNSREGKAPQNIPTSPMHGMPTQREQQMDTLLEARRQSDQQRIAAANSGMGLKLSPFDDPRLPWAMREMINKQVPRPHYTPVDQQALQKAIAMEEANIANAPEAQRPAMWKAYHDKLWGVGARNANNPWAIMAGYGQQRSEMPGYYNDEQ